MLQNPECAVRIAAALTWHSCMHHTSPGYTSPGYTSPSYTRWIAASAARARHHANNMWKEQLRRGVRMHLGGGAAAVQAGTVRGLTVRLQCLPPTPRHIIPFRSMTPRRFSWCLSIVFPPHCFSKSTSTAHCTPRASRRLECSPCRQRLVNGPEMGTQKNTASPRVAFRAKPFLAQSLHPGPVTAGFPRGNTVSPPSCHPR